MLLLLRISHYRILSNYDSYSIIVRIEIVESAIATELDMISFISDDIVKRVCNRALLLFALLET